MLTFGLGLFLCAFVGTSSAVAQGAISVQGIASDLFDKSADDYDGGPGLELSGFYRIHKFLDVRANVGARFLEGNQIAQMEGRRAPDLGARWGERPDKARVMPFTVDLIVRAEQWSKGRFWVPYAGVGIGFYDVEVTYLPSLIGEEPPETEGFARGDDPDSPVAEDTRTARLYKFGWNGKAGVRLYRTSGMFVNLESAVHGIDTDRRWQPMWDVSVGVGFLLPVGKN